MEEMQLDNPHAEIDFLVDEDPEELEQRLEEYQREQEILNAKTDFEKGIEKLPRDIFLYMSGYIEPEQLSALCRVNKNFYNHICNSKFWLQKLINTYGVSRKYIDMTKGPNNTYYGLYQELEEAKNMYIPTLAGFKTPIRVTDNMREFIRNGDFGLSDPNDPNSPPLNQMLMVTENNITTRSMLTPLFNIYAHVNDMQQDPNNKQYLTSTPTMDQYFRETYLKLARRPEKFRRDGTPIPGFDPKRFRYASLQYIISENTDRSRKLIENVAVIKKLLERDQVTISNALKVYRDRMRH